MYCTYRRPLGAAVSVIVHTVVMVVVVGAFGMFGTFGGGVVRASEAVASSAASSAAAEIIRGCPEVIEDRHQLRVRLVPAKGVDAQVIKIAQAEVVKLWESYGVDVIWEKVWTGEASTRPDLFVNFIDQELGGNEGRGASAVAWILFVGGAPREFINVSLKAANRLLNDTVWLDERPVRMAPLNMQYSLLGRMVGRALAHEIGHYLLASSKHADDGLMRPMITPQQFVRIGHRHLQLMPEDVRALRAARLVNCQLSVSR
jgi:hypothetical protein